MIRRGGGSVGGCRLPWSWSAGGLLMACRHISSKFSEYLEGVSRFFFFLLLSQMLIGFSVYWGCRIGVRIPRASSRRSARWSSASTRTSVFPSTGDTSRLLCSDLRRTSTPMMTMRIETVQCSSMSHFWIGRLRARHQHYAFKWTQEKTFNPARAPRTF